MSDGQLFVILGATGDLTRRKLFPAIYELLTKGRHSRSAILGVSRTALDDEAFREFARESLGDAGFDEDEVAKWCDDCVHYVQVEKDEDYHELTAKCAEIESEHDLPGNRIFYLALPPAAFPSAIEDLGNAGLSQAPGWVRLVVEKPFGTDLESARSLNEVVHRWFPEESVYRIDHYLGKETVQNLLVFRFANSIFESSWNRDRIEAVEITVAESIGIEGRGAYYESAGVIRDMVQNHITQVLALVAMEPPASYTPQAIRNEKVKVIESLKPISTEDVVFGQYRAGSVAGRDLSDYSVENGVADGSTAPTYVAMRLGIDNWRWQDVPFYVRTGKALPRRVTQIAVSFRDTPINFFRSFEDHPEVGRDQLLITLQPDEGFELRIEVKEPSDDMTLKTIPLSFDYSDEFGDLPDAYETLLDDVVQGDQTLFVRADMVERSWELYAPILDVEEAPLPYPAGTWGPEAADELLARGRGWTTR
jgi:glucose-6-phosphate 1-dehydrogenase